MSYIISYPLIIILYCLSCTFYFCNWFYNEMYNYYQNSDSLFYMYMITTEGLLQLKEYSSVKNFNPCF